MVRVSVKWNSFWITTHNFWFMRPVQKSVLYPVGTYLWSGNIEIYCTQSDSVPISCYFLRWHRRKVRTSSYRVSKRSSPLSIGWRYRYELRKILTRNSSWGRIFCEISLLFRLCDVVRSNQGIFEFSRVILTGRAILSVGNSFFLLQFVSFDFHHAEWICIYAGSSTSTFIQMKAVPYLFIFSPVHLQLI